MKLEIGKYYRTRDGRKVGPMVFSPEYETYAWDDGSETGWTVSGFMSQHGERDGDIIAEWTDTPEVGTLKEIGAEVGDVVREANFPNKKVIAYHDGEPNPWVLECQETKEIDYWAGDYAGWRIISRAQNGPVRTVTTTRREIIPGVYGRVGVERVTRPYVHLHFTGDSMLDADEITAAIATLTAIRDAMQANATA